MLTPSPPCFRLSLSLSLPLSHRLRKPALRALFLALQTALGLALIGGSGDVILGLQSLSGAIGMTMLTYVLPYWAYALLFPEEMTAGKKVCMTDSLTD